MGASVEATIDMVLDLEVPPADWLAAAARACDADVAGLYNANAGGEVTLAVTHNASAEVLRERLLAWYALESEFGWTPQRPEPQLANVAVRTLAIHRRARDLDNYNEVVAKPLGIPVPAHDQLRALLYEGPELLAWLGVVRPKPFDSKAAAKLQRLVPAVRARLRCERRLATHQPRARAFEALIARTNEAVALVSEDGRIHFASPRAALALRGISKDEVARRVKEGSSTVVRVGSNALLFMQDDSTTRLRALASRWSLTPREIDVAELVIEGLCNKEIASRLGLASGTVAIHVGHVLDKAGVGSRTRLAAVVLGARAEAEGA